MKLTKLMLQIMITFIVIVILAHLVTWGPPLLVTAAICLALSHFKYGRGASNPNQEKSLPFNVNAVVLGAWAVKENFLSTWAAQVTNALLETMFMFFLIVSVVVTALSLLNYFNQPIHSVLVKRKDLWLWMFFTGISYWFLVWLNSFLKLLSIPNI